MCWDCQKKAKRAREEESEKENEDPQAEVKYHLISVLQSSRQRKPFKQLQPRQKRARVHDVKAFAAITDTPHSTLQPPLIPPGDLVDLSFSSLQTIRLVDESAWQANRAANSGWSTTLWQTQPSPPSQRLRGTTSPLGSFSSNSGRICCSSSVFEVRLQEASSRRASPISTGARRRTPLRERRIRLQVTTNMCLDWPDQPSFLAQPAHS